MKAGWHGHPIAPSRGVRLTPDPRILDTSAAITDWMPPWNDLDRGRIARAVQGTRGSRDRRGLHHGQSHRSWLRWTTAEIQRLRIAVIVAPSKDGRAICAGVAAGDADTGSPAEGCADVKGLREIAAQQPGAVEACAARRPPCLCSGTRLRQLAQVQAGVHHERDVILTDHLRREGA